MPTRPPPELRPGGGGVALFAALPGICLLIFVVAYLLRSA